ncbi:MAG: nucleotidyltransferase family protein [Clostridium sp.]
MSFNKLELMDKVNSNEFKNIFINMGITNVLIFGSLTREDFNEESDIDICVISRKNITFDMELRLITMLEEMLEREIDIINIDDVNISNVIKFEALRSKTIVCSDELLEEKLYEYEKLFKENEEFWYFLDKAVLSDE